METVYVVYFDMYGEGMDPDTLEVYGSEEAAEEYAKLLRNRPFGEVIIVPKEIFN